MDKVAIKNFAIWARKKLREEIVTRAGFLGITDKEILNPLPASNEEIQYFDIGADKPVAVRGEEIQQRDQLVRKLSSDAKKSDYRSAYGQLVETTASDWFNRLIAIRYMEINEYEPLNVRLLSSVEEGKQDPDLVSSPFDGDLDFTDGEQRQIVEWKGQNEAEQLFRFLLLRMCRELYRILPGIFQRPGDYSEILMRLSFIDRDGVVYHLVHDIAEEDWKDQVQIIGWIYQYYNTELKDETFALLKKNVKITKERIPSATQLFTPDWIVRYMVENSVGRLWLEGHPQDRKQFLPTREEQEAFVAGDHKEGDRKWHYYLEEAPQEPEVEVQLGEIRKEYARLNPEDIRCIDPCMGSGHILVYMFDVLMQIYESVGYSQREAAKAILKNNLYGLDIDERAYQLAYFAVMMKARKYNRRILTSGIRPHVYVVAESNDIDQEAVAYFCNGDDALTAAMDTILAELQDAKEYGSILTVTDQDWEKIYGRFGEIEDEISIYKNVVQERLLPVVQVAEALARKYWVACTNPPYAGTSNLSADVNKYVKKKYPDSKADLFAVFIERCGEMVCRNGYQAMITQHAWMFLSSFEKLRGKLLQRDIVNMAHLGARAFEEIGGEVVQTTSFVMCKSCIDKYKGTYVRLTEPTSQTGKENIFLVRGDNQYIAEQKNFYNIPGMPIAYWVSNKVFRLFNDDLLGNIYYIKAGICTGENAIFILNWHEVDYCKTYMSSPNNYLYTAHNKGGEYRKWYGNRELVLKYNSSSLIKMEKNKGFRHDGKEYYFKEHIGWSKIASGNTSFRYFEKGFTFDSAGLGLFAKSKQNIYVTLSFLNSRVAKEFIALLNPTLNVTPLIVKKLPYTTQIETREIESFAKENILICKDDWDSFETSWDFERHPLLKYASFSMKELEQDTKHFVCDMNYIKDAFANWSNECGRRFQQLKANEEELNRIFIDIYGLQDELTPEVADKDITVRKADLGRDIRSFLSYAVGCMFGRYSLDVNGLAYAGGEWDSSKYTTFLPDDDNVIPLTDQKYLEDDIVERFCEFLTVVYGKETLEENLEFIAEALKGKGTSSREIIRNYFLQDFFKEHCKIYQKRPIYWLFDSGKQNGFKALVYMHRWNEDTTGRVELYLQEIQKKYETEIRAIDMMLDHITDHRQAVTEERRREHLQRQVEELLEYDERLSHMVNERVGIDLDDGVKRNYEKVQTDRQGKVYKILAPIK